MATNFYMFSEEGNAALEAALTPIFDNIRSVSKDVERAFRKVAVNHPEVFDTEPRAKTWEMLEEVLEQVLKEVY